MVDIDHIFTIPCSVERIGKVISEDDKKQKPPAGKSSEKTYTESLSGILCIHNTNPQHCFVISCFSMTQSEHDSITDGFMLLKNSNQFAKVRACTNARDSEKTVMGPTLKAAPLIAWRSPSFAETFQKIFSPKKEWALADDTNSDAKFNTEHLSWFILYQVDPVELSSKYNVHELTSVTGPRKCDKLSLRSGQSVKTRSFPFEPSTFEIFADTVSCGVVSNIAGAIFLIDARCLPGSEGGGVFSNQKGDSQQLIGLIVVPLCWKNEELIGFTVCCSITEIISSLFAILQDTSRVHDSMQTSRLYKANLFLNSWIKDQTKVELTSRTQIFEPDVVRVEVNDVWGSGIVVAAKVTDNSGEVFVLTCRHVIENVLQKKTIKIKVYFQNIKKCYFGNVLFSTDEEACFDLALIRLHCEKDMIHKLCLDKLEEDFPTKRKLIDKDIYLVPHITPRSQISKGDPVYVKGYGLFDSSSNLKPTLSQGVISTFVHADVHDIHKPGSAAEKAFLSMNLPRSHLPVLLHSTCAVHKGASGGAFICCETNKLQGMVVNHIRDEAIRVSYPHVNFSIPTNVFMPPIMDYLATGNLNSLNSLNCKNNKLKSIWNMQESTHSQEEMIRSKL